jgi:hypothetical protein
MLLRIRRAGVHPLVLALAALVERYLMETTPK